MTVHFNKQRQVWVFDFKRMGQRHQGYCLGADGQPVTSKSAAVQAEGVARRRAEMAPKVADAREVTFSMVLATMMPRWQREASWADKKRQAAELLQFFGGATPVRDINEDRIRAYVDFALAQPLKVWLGGPGDDQEKDDARLWRVTDRTRSPATVNRYLSLLRQILRRAGEMRDEHGRSILAFVPPVKELAELKRRARPTPEPVLQRLMEILPQHAIDAVVLTLYFGFRQGEAFGLQEDNCDWLAGGVRLFAEDVKDDEDTFLPGPQEAMGYLRALAMEGEARGLRHLISFRQETREGRAEQHWRPIKSPKRAWATAMKVIEKEFGRRWRWHDIRAAFITHVAMTSGALAAQKLARHSTYDTTQAYVEVADEQRRMAAERAAVRPALSLIGKKGSH
jgi:hypothetical protein